jgi:hypothetical protein
MRRIGLAVALAISLILGPLVGEAQPQSGKVYRIGYLTVPSRETAQGVADSFQRGLRDLGLPRSSRR